MKTVAALCALAGLATIASADVIASWTYEVSIPTTAGPHTAEAGVNAAGSTSTGFHAGASTYSNPAGNGSFESFSSTNWVAGDHYQFRTSTTNFTSLDVSFDHTSSNTGPRDFNLEWSTDGVLFTNVASYSVLANASPNPVWSSGTYNAIYTFAFTLPAGAANQADVWFRLTQVGNVSANGGTVASGGTSRVDNFTVNGTFVPAPGALALVGMAGLVAGRRRR